MRVLLSTYGSREDVEQLAGLAVELQKAGAEVRVCAPPDEDFKQRLSAVGVRMGSVGPSARAKVVAQEIRTDGAAVAAKLLLDGSR